MSEDEGSGIKRITAEDGAVEEATFRTNKRHGLSRVVTADLAKIQLYKDGELISHFHFDSEFNEIERKSDELKDLNPLYFKPGKKKDKIDEKSVEEAERLKLQEVYERIKQYNFLVMDISDTYHKTYSFTP